AMPSAPRIELIGVPDLPLVQPGDDLGRMIAAALERNELKLATGDVLVLAQKIVSKAEGRFVDLAAVQPSERALALAADRDKSLAAHCGCQLAVIINDSFGRAWRRGTVGVALGVAGLPAVRDLRGQPDLFDRALQVTVVGFADEIAAAASLIMGQAAEKLPVVLVRGLAWTEAPTPAQSLVRPAAEDLFR